MAIYYKLGGGFIDSEIMEVPAGAILISDAEHQELLAGQSAGMMIVEGADGRPYCAAPLPPTLAEAREKVLEEIKIIRDTALNAPQGNAGRHDLYGENYRMAEALINGKSDVVSRVDGISPGAYCERFGARMGLSPEEWAQYVITEYNQLAPNIAAIEERYLALAYGGHPEQGILPLGMIDDIEALLDQPRLYREFCGL